MKQINLDIQKFSGGSYDYKFIDVDNFYAGRMHDYELDELMTDLVKVLHDLEWWQSCDISEDSYRKTVKEFKDKWFKKTREDRLKKIIETKTNELKEELEKLI